MKRIILLFPMLCRCVIAVPVHWTGIDLRNWGSSGGRYGFYGDIYGENDTYTWIHSEVFGHTEGGGVYLKHLDFSKETMEPTYNWWALALYGEVVGEATFDTLTRIEDFQGNDYNTGGTQVENPNDFYMVFKASEVLLENHEYVEGMTWYGWVRVSVDDDLRMTLLGSDINLTGGAVTVGATAAPEPSSALLLLVGSALLALRRRALV